MSSPGASKQYRIERERRERLAREENERTRLKRGAAKHAIGFWNAALAAGWRTIFYPTVGTALATGCHWLHVVCPACQQMGEADLRQIDIHTNASLGTVVRAMSCRRCSPQPPFARPLGATKRSWYGTDGWLRDPYRASLRGVEFIEADDIGWGRGRSRARKGVPELGTTSGSRRFVEVPVPHPEYIGPAPPPGAGPFFPRDGAAPCALRQVGYARSGNQ